VERETKGWRRHLDGWQAGAVMLLLAGSAILLAAPRAVEPEHLPVPLHDLQALSATMRADDERAKAAQLQTLDVDVRALGRELRAYNMAAADDKEEQYADARIRVARAADKAKRRDPEELLRLRAYQMRRFVSELEKWQQDGTVTSELKALGGDFLVVLERNAWCRGGRRLILGEAELRVLFKKRWNALSGLRTGPYALTVDEDRVRFGFLLRHPFSPNDPVHRAPRRRQAAGKRLARQRLLMIDRLAARDPSYPAQLARGVVYYQSGQWTMASNAFRRHLDEKKEGAFALRARNYLKAALDRTHQAGF